MPLLPTELLSLILDHLTTDDCWDIDSLRACSTVSSEFRTPAQKRLFSTTTLNILFVPGPPARRRKIVTSNKLTTSQGEQFLALISNPQSSHLGAFVEKLWIRTVRWDTKNGPSSDSEGIDLSTPPRWYAKHIRTRSQSLARILPLLIKLRTIRLGVRSWPFPIDYLHPAAREAIFKICKTQITSLDLLRSASFPFEELGEPRSLRRLAIRELPPVGNAADGPSPTLRPEKIRLDTLCVLYSFFPPLDDRQRPWVTNPNSPFDVSRLRRLVLLFWDTLHPDDILPLCAETLEHLQLGNCHSGYVCRIRYSETRRPAFDFTFPTIRWRTPPLNLASHTRLTTLHLSAQYILSEQLDLLDELPSGESGLTRGQYTTSLPWVCACIRNIPSDCMALEDITVVLEFLSSLRGIQNPVEDAQEEEIVSALDFSFLARALMAESDSEEDSYRPGGTDGRDHDERQLGKLRFRNLKRLQLDILCTTPALRDTVTRVFLKHPDIVPLDRLGILRTSYGVVSASPPLTRLDVFDGWAYH